MKLVNLIPLNEIDIKSKARVILSKSNYDEKAIHKLKDVARDIVSDLRGGNSNELKSKLKSNTDGLYVQTDELGGTILFNDGSEYELVANSGGDIKVNKNK